MNELSARPPRKPQEKSPVLSFYIRDGNMDHNYHWHDLSPEAITAELQARWRMWRNDSDPNRVTPRAGFHLYLHYTEIPTDDVAFTLDGPPNIFDELDRVADDIKHFLKEHRNAASNA